MKLNRRSVEWIYGFNILELRLLVKSKNTNSHHKQKSNVLFHKIIALSQYFPSNFLFRYHGATFFKWSIIISRNWWTIKHLQDGTSTASDIRFGRSIELQKQSEETISACRQQHEEQDHRIGSAQ